MDARALAELSYRLVTVLRFAAFMAFSYVVLHVLAARLCRPEGRVLAFFQTLTSPLTRPIRRFAPTLTEAGVRLATLGALGVAWLILAWLHALIGGRRG